MSLLEDSLNGAQLEEVQYQLRAAEALGTDTTMDAAVVTSPRKGNSLKSFTLFYV